VFFCSFWSVFRFDEVFLQNKRVSCSQACRPGAVASTGEENDCGIFFLENFSKFQNTNSRFVNVEYWQFIKRVVIL
jgi:hypothetical protein